MTDREAPDPTRAASEAWRTLQDLGSRLTKAARSVAEDLANAPGSELMEPVAKLNAGLAAMSTAWVQPVRSMLDEQQELMDTLAAWAEQQQVLAERFSELARRHRQLANQTAGLLEPILRESERLRSWAQSSRSTPAD